MKEGLMVLRTALLVAFIAMAAPACTVYVQEPGAVASDGSVYLGFHLFSGRKAAGDRESYEVGQKHGAFSSIRLHTDDPVNITEVFVIFADGERYTAPAPGALAAEGWTNPIPLPRGPRPIHSIVVGAKGQTKKLANIEIYGTR